MMRAPTPLQFAAAALAMAAVVLASNILVQFPLNDLLTWGAITYPVAFLVSELVNRAHGPQQARWTDRQVNQRRGHTHRARTAIQNERQPAA